MREAMRMWLAPLGKSSQRPWVSLVQGLNWTVQLNHEAVFRLIFIRESKLLSKANGTVLNAEKIRQLALSSEDIFFILAAIFPHQENNVYKWKLTIRP